MPDGRQAATRKEYLRLAPQWALSDDIVSASGGYTHCLVFDAGRKSRARGHKMHVWSCGLPGGSFYRLSYDIYVSSPEFAFLQLAGLVDVRELIAYGNEICGYYSFDAGASRGFQTRSKPLTTKSKLADYLAQAHNCKGRKRSQRAVKYIVEGAASPMESAIAMLNSLPCKKLGGYGLEAPVMNHPIVLSAQAAQMANRKTCYADVCYPRISLDVEYHGRYDHAKDIAFDSDRARVNGLIEMGFEVIEVTHRQVENLVGYEAIAQYIARKLGTPIRRENLGPQPQRLLLRTIIREWNRSSGVPSFLR